MFDGWYKIRGRVIDAVDENNLRVQIDAVLDRSDGNEIESDGIALVGRTWQLQIADIAHLMEDGTQAIDQIFDLKINVHDLWATVLTLDDEIILAEGRLEQLRKKKRARGMNKLVDQCAHLALAAVQDAIGQGDGSWAGMYFDERPGDWAHWNDIIRDYIEGEISQGLEVKLDG